MQLLMARARMNHMAKSSSVLALLHGGGTSGSTIITDSIDLTTWTANGGAKISNAQSKFGGTSILCGPSGYISADTPAALGPTGGDFTIEAFVYLNSLGSIQVVFATWVDATDIDLRILVNSDNSIQLGYSNSHSVQSAANVVTSGVWHHLAYSLSGTTVYGFVDGVQVVTGTFPTISSVPVVIAEAGQNHGGIWFLQGYIDELRFTRGLAQYTANFTPPSAPFSYP